MADTVIKESKNIVKIVGTLVENSLKPGSYKDSTTGEEKEYISGSLVIRVEQTVSDKQEIEEIPVYTWVPKFTKSGKNNPGYDSMAKAMNTFVSLAATGNESTADKVSITMANIRENLYSADGETVFSTPRIFTNFANKPGQNTVAPEATFTNDIVIGKITEEVNKEGLPTGRLKIIGMISNYDGSMSNIDYYAENKDAINYIRSYWQEGETVQISGRIRWTNKTEHIEVPTRFGEPVFKNKTVTCKELIITADSSDMLTPEQKFTKAEIERGQELRATKVEKEKQNAKNKKNGTNIGKPTTTNTPDYGF